MKSFDLKELLTSKAILTVTTTKSCMFSCILYVPVKELLHNVNFIWKQDHLTTLTYHYKYIIPLLYKIFHSFADNPSHTVPQALAIASELAISLRRWSNIDNWHAECVYVGVILITFQTPPFSNHTFLEHLKKNMIICYPYA